MIRLPKDPVSTDSNVVAFCAQDAVASRMALQDAFRANERRLLAYLTARLGGRADAQDVAQSAFLKLWEQAAKLRDENLVSLLFVTARNLATDRIRSSKCQREQALCEDDERMDRLADDAPAADRIVAARHDLKIISLILSELPGKCRAAFVYYKFDGHSYAEIATAMGLTESMIRKYVRRGMAHCATRYAELEGWE